MDSPMDIKSMDEQKTTKRKVFNDIYLELKIFKDWLRQSSNANKALCSFCEIEMACKKSVLIKHAKSKKHRKNSRIVDPTLSFASDDENYIINENIENENMQKAEIEISAFIAAHNIPISAVDDMVALFNRLSVTDGIPGKLVLSRKKCSNIITNVLGEKQSQDLSQNLIDNKFSVLVDESTTIAGDKLLCIVVKYIAPNGQLLTELFELVILDTTNCSASKLYEAPRRSAQLKEFQNFFDLPQTKILKVASTRWLSTQKCIARLLENWEPSKMFTLNTFNKFNALFQSRETYIHILAERSEWILKQMTMCFLKPDCLNNITINSIVPENILPTLFIKVGDKCLNLLDTLDREVVFQIKSNCLLFYKTATIEMIQRVPYYDLCVEFNLVDLVNNINQEWLDLPNLFNDEDIQFLSGLTEENMWKEIFA
ncbi:hypothetical protein PV327_011290, partial [Microctonus hyperodae]